MSGLTVSRPAAGLAVRVGRWLARLRGSVIPPLAVGVLAVTSLLLTGLWTVPALVAVGVQAIITAGLVWWQSYVSKTNVELASTTVALMAETPDDAIDRVLGLLIGVEDRPFTTEEAFSSLFALLSARIPGSDFVFQRRLAEALPRLATFNEGRAFELARELRTTFDGRWKGDIRRRVIESLYLPVGGHRPFIYALTRDQKLDLLLPHHQDDIYVRFSQYECLYAPTLSEKAMPKKLRAEIKARLDCIDQDRDKREAIDLLVRIWTAARDGKPDVAESLIGSGFDQIHRYKNVVAARAAVSLALGNTDRRLEYIESIVTHSLKNVSRVAAREVSVRFLLGCLRNRNVRAKAEELLKALTDNEDDIIRASVLDVLEFGYRGERLLRDQLLDNLLGRDTKGELSERIARTRAKECATQ
jgi:hypothetical protein